MDCDLLPSVSLRPRSFNALVAPNEMFARALNRNLNLQRFKVLYICGNYSSVLYEEAQGMVEYVSQGLHDAAKEATVLLYSPGTDTFLEDMTKNADRVFYFDEGPRATTKLISKAYPKAQKSQTTLEAFT